LAFISFSLTGIARMEGTAVVEAAEVVAKTLIVELRKKITDSGWWRKTVSIPCENNVIEFSGYRWQPLSPGYVVSRYNRLQGNRINYNSTSTKSMRLKLYL
jgi:hypothetical protein